MRFRYYNDLVVWSWLLLCLLAFPGCRAASPRGTTASTSRDLQQVVVTPSRHRRKMMNKSNKENRSSPPPMMSSKKEKTPSPTTTTTTVPLPTTNPPTPTPCSVCGDGQEVTAPEALFEFVLFPEPIRCGALEQLVAEGEYSDSSLECEYLPTLEELQQVCQCQAIQPNVEYELDDFVVTGIQEETEALAVLEALDAYLYIQYATRTNDFRGVSLSIRRKNRRNHNNDDDNFTTLILTSH